MFGNLWDILTLLSDRKNLRTFYSELILSLYIILQKGLRDRHLLFHPTKFMKVIWYLLV